VATSHEGLIRSELEPGVRFIPPNCSAVPYPDPNIPDANDHHPYQPRVGEEPATAPRDPAWCSRPGSPAAACTARVAATPSSTSSARRGSCRRTPARTIPPPAGRSNASNRTLKNWLRAQSTQPATLADLQTLLDSFVEEYNHRRPHRSLPHHATPATAYQNRPKAVPGDARIADTHDRVRTDKVCGSPEIVEGSLCCFSVEGSVLVVDR